MIDLFKAMFKLKSSNFTEPVVSSIERARKANEAVYRKADEAIDKLLEKLAEKERAETTARQERNG
jgi:hypothetical protein